MVVTQLAGTNLKGIDDSPNGCHIRSKHQSKVQTDKAHEPQGELVDEGKKDACYHKVKSCYSVWPSAYASGALVQAVVKLAPRTGRTIKEEE